MIWGQQSFDEMMVCMFNVAFPSTYTTKDILSPPKEDKTAKVDKAAVEQPAK